MCYFVSGTKCVLQTTVTHTLGIQSAPLSSAVLASRCRLLYWLHVQAGTGADDRYSYRECVEMKTEEDI
ncbi:hypothetical protein ScPMuIL_006977 [Solemya velum]